MSHPKGAEPWDGRFGTDETAEEDDSGACSPPLWRSSSPTLSDGGRRHCRRARRHLSPASRIQAIERGRMELMEMVRNMPESSYELSLKDLVEHQPPSTAAAAEEEEEEEDHRGSHSSAEGIARQRSEKKAAARLKRSGSADKGGFLLKLVFPIRFGSNRTRKSRIKKNNSVGSNGSWSKVSPKPAAAAAAPPPEKEWWKKRSKDAGGSEGSRSINSSCSSVSRQVSRSWPRCWTFFRRSGKSKRATG